MRYLITTAVECPFAGSVSRVTGKPRDLQAEALECILPFPSTKMETPAGMLDLFAIAKANAETLETAFESLVATMPGDQAALVRNFASWVEANALISISVKLYVIGDLLGGRPYQNKHEWAEEQAGLCGRVVDEILMENLGSYYEKRIAFDRAFNGGEKFRYGALYAGGAGLTEYGAYCIVLSRVYLESLAGAAYLPGDSLEICLGATGAVDEEAVRRFTAPHTHRHLMAAIERAAEIPACGKSEWWRLVVLQVGDTFRYFEVIFVGDVALGSIEYVCVLKVENDRMWQLAFANFGRKLGDAERALANDFIVLRRGVSEGKVRLEVIT